MLCKIAKTARRASSDRRPFLFDVLSFFVAGLREREKENGFPLEKKKTKEERERKKQRKRKKKVKEKEIHPLP